MLRNAIVLLLIFLSSSLMAEVSCHHCSRPVIPLSLFINSANSKLQNQEFGVKSQDQLEKYFSCYQLYPARHQAYLNHYQESLTNAANAIEASFGLNSYQVNAVLSCLIFRESAHWQEGAVSNTGARGLGQFTTVAINQIKENLNINPTWAKRRIADIEKHHSHDAVAQAEKRKIQRRLKLQKMWKEEIKGSVAVHQINKNFLGNNRNHRDVIGLVAVHFAECLDLYSHSRQLEAKDLLMACAGAYNMGVGAFENHAMRRLANNQHSVKQWAANLRNSNSRQRNETHNHLLSIYRCASDDQNLPPCGTDPHCFHHQNFSNQNACRQKGAIQCTNEKC